LAVPEAVSIHRTAELVGDGPEGFAEALLVRGGHYESGCEPSG